jgi:hypothetical protein
VPQLSLWLQFSQSADAKEHIEKIAMAGNIHVTTFRNTKASIYWELKRLEKASTACQTKKFPVTDFDKMPQNLRHPVKIARLRGLFWHASQYLKFFCDFSTF